MGYSPMLAAEAELGKINYGKQGMVLLPKHNGVRGCNQDGLLTARSLKKIPNDFTRELFSHNWFSNLEGELVVGDPFDEEVFSISTSGVMSKAGTPDVNWFLFDMFHETAHFIDRLEMLAEAYDCIAHKSRVQVIEHHIIHSDEELTLLSDKYLRMGFEGVVLRRPDLAYKQGRSTAKEQGLMRFCPWFYSEGIITAINEGTVNMNVSKVNELGYKRKSSHKENLVPSGQAGTVTVFDAKLGLSHDVKVQTDKLQKEVWNNKARFMGGTLKYRYKPPVKIGGKPRFAQWEGIRHEDDMS